MRSVRVLGLFAITLLTFACSDRGGKPADEADRHEAPKPVAPRPPAQQPELPDTAERDADGNRLDDVFDAQLANAKGDALTQTMPLEVILSRPVEQGDLDDFVAEGGKVRYVFKELSYGWTGAAALEKLPPIAARLGDKLHLVAAPSVVVPFMDEATRTGRIRGIWAVGFAGSGAGYSGNSNITIAVLDTGVDSSHTDLNGRQQGFKDYTTDAAVTARDVEGHGTHVASIAVGSGAAFGSAVGSLKFTQSGTLSGVGAGSFLAGTVHTPTYLGSAATLNVSTSATFLGGASTTLHALRAPDASQAYTSFANVTGTSPLALSNQNGGTSGMIYQGGLVQSNPAAVTNFAVTNTVSSYPNVGDGFNTLRGVAPTCKFFGGKVFLDNGTGNSLDIAEGLDDVVSRKSSDNIKIANLSLGVSGSGTDTVMRAKVNTTVDAGVVVIVAAGNDGPSTTMGDPARASKVITVGATNDVNELTTYTSLGPTSPGSDEDTKPDVVAPGGSFYRSGILAADTNTADGNSSGFADLVANDYSSLQGTSMATPFVSGSVALMIDALQQSGTSWSFGSNAQPLFLKMLLGASATELNLSREQSAANSPTLGRAATPKDRFEGFGIINPDAAIEALVQSFSSPMTGSVSNTSPARLEWERRAWGRKIGLINGSVVTLSLSVPSTADFDLYLYSGSADGKGNPTIRASSVNAGTDTDEAISFTSSTTETAYLFVKRVSGYGSFTLTGANTNHCGDGDIDAGEACDPAMVGSTTCCTATCTAVANNTGCSDGNKCTQTDTCQSGVCTGGNAVVCSASDQCHDVGTCDTSTGTCSNPKKTDNTSCNDNNKCTQTDTCQAGVCTGSNAVTCTASDQCHDAGTCDTSTGTCSNPKKTDNTSCNDNDKCTQTDTCQAGVCTGSNAVTCAASDQCHSAGTCDTSTGVCSNPKKADNTSCSDGNKCTQTDTCQAGVCTGSNAVVCSASDQCHDVGTCDSSTGACSNPKKSDNTGCNDGNKCTQTDTCQAGVCTGSNAVTCTASDQCHTAGSCDTTTGTCSNPKKADNTGCNDGDKCTQTDTCQAGVCTGSNAVVCSASDRCHSAGTCDASTGSCSNPAKADNTSCNDGNKCTQTDTCQGGVCTGSNGVVCSASDQCHDAGTCDTATGTCSNPAKSDGSKCDDGSKCTQTDSCEAGACVGKNPVVCSATDPCHDAGSCDGATGSCSSPAKANGTGCDDGDACTKLDSCQSGVCTGKNPVTCAAVDPCHDAGSCDSATGACSTPAKADGTPCNDGNKCTQTDTCQAGACTGAAVVCAALDQCHDAGVCDGATGICSNPPKTNGAPCSDGDACTQTDSCQAGACTGKNPVICAALDQCHLPGTCDAVSGACSNPAKADGVACNDGSFCTKNDQCLAGACTGGTAVVCTALDQCHDVGACDPASGLCSNPSVGDGSPCSDGDACTQGDACEAGVCASGTPTECAPPDDCHEAGVCQAPGGGCNYAVKTNGSPCGVQGSCQAGQCVEPSGNGGAGGGVQGGSGQGGSGQGGSGQGGSGGIATAGTAGAPSGGVATSGAGGTSATAGTDASGAGTRSGGGAATEAPLGGAPSEPGTAGNGTGEPEPSEGGGSATLPDTAPPKQSSGCGCSVPGKPTSGRELLLLTFGAAALIRARRRRAA